MLQIDTAMISKQKEGAIRQFALMLARIWKGKVGEAWEGLKLGVVESKVRRKLGTLQAESEDQQRSMAVCNLRSVMWRIAKGRVATYVEQWRGHMKRDMLLRGDTMRVRLEAEMKAGRHVAATRQLVMVLAKLLRGRLGAAWQGMRFGLSESKNRRNIVMMSFKCDAQLRMVAVRQMRRRVWYHVRDMTGTYLLEWVKKMRNNLLDEKDLKIKRLSEVRSEVKSGQISDGLMKLAQVMVGIMRGELSTALFAMRFGMLCTKKNRVMHAMSGRTEAQLRSAAVKEMRMVLSRYLRKES